MADLGGMGFKCNHLASIFNSTTPCEMSLTGPGCISAWIFIFITFNTLLVVAFNAGRAPDRQWTRHQ